MLWLEDELIAYSKVSSTLYPARLQYTCTLIPSDYLRVCCTSQFIYSWTSYHGLKDRIPQLTVRMEDLRLRRSITTSISSITIG